MILFYMRNKTSLKTITMQEGEYLEKEFEGYTDLAKHAVDWTLFCPYRLQKTSFTGILKILSLPSMQIIYNEMDGGMMFDLVIPKDCVTFSVMKHISNKTCIDEMKLSTGMISVIDDKKTYNFTYKESITIIDVSVHKDANPLLLKTLSQAVDKYFIDTDKNIVNLLESLINKFCEKSPLETKISTDIQNQVTQAMIELTSSQKAMTPSFTQSEQIAIKIKKELFAHMDANISTASLSKTHNISQRSLQNAFKSLYDLTPTQFIRLLKLNHVHHELVQKNAKGTSVIRVAQKWGFKHMGKFSAYYTELFKENPSVTLKTDEALVNEMNEACVQRQEEI